MTESENREFLEIFDPREGSDFRFGPYRQGNFVSSLSENLLVVHITPRLWVESSLGLEVRKAALSSFDLERGAGLVCALSAPKSVEDEIPNAMRRGEGVLGWFPASRANFTKYLGLIKNASFGEITVGSTEDDSSVAAHCHASQAEDFDLLFLIREVGKLSWLMSFYADTGDTLVVATPGQRSDAFLEKVGPLGRVRNTI